MNRDPFDGLDPMPRGFSWEGQPLQDVPAATLLDVWEENHFEALLESDDLTGSRLRLALYIEANLPDLIEEDAQDAADRQARVDKALRQTPPVNVETD